MSGGEMTSYNYDLERLIDWADAMNADSHRGEHGSEYISSTDWLSGVMKSLYSCLFVVDRTMSGDRSDEEAVEAIKEFRKKSGIINSTLTHEDMTEFRDSFWKMYSLMLKLEEKEERK